MASKHRYQELYTDNPILISSENFAHDADTLLLQAEIAKKAASVLRINQKKIVKKQQQTTSKNLHKCVEKYNGCLVEIRDAVNRIQDTLSDDGLDEMKLSRKNEVLRPHNAAKRKRDRPQTVCDDLGPEIECMSCIGKEIDIKKLQDELESLKQKGQEYDDLHQIYNELHKKYEDERDQRTKYEHLYGEEQKGKEDALGSLKQKHQEYDELHQIYNSLYTKYEDERDQRTKYQRLYKEEQKGKEDALGSDQFGPTKIAENMSELYDNQWTDAYSVLEERGLEEKQIIQSLLDMFMAAYTECSKLASENFFERAQRCIEIPAEGFQLPLDYKEVMPDQLKRQVKEFRKARAPHVVKEVEMILMTRIKSENQDLEAVSVYLSHCIEIAWICAVQDPPFALRGDAPDKFDTNSFKEYTRRGRYTEFVVWPALYLHDGGALLSKGVAQGSDKTAPDQSVTKAGMSSKAQEELRDINPNIADLSDQFRPTKLAEKMSELYDHQWTDAYTVLEEQGLGEKQIIESLLDMFMAAYTECRKSASEKLCERVKRCIEIPTEIVMKRIKSENQDLEAVSAYLSHCIEIAWICAVQDPPIILRRDAPVEFDTNAFKEYTREGKYTEFVVLPALYLHDGGVLLSKGVAQGSDTTAPDQKDTIAGMSSKAQEELCDINPNIADLSDQFRPTKLAEKMSELYDHQWTDAYTVLEEQGLGEKQIIESLLDMFMAAYTECRKSASEKLCERVKRCIEIPTEIVMKRIKSENQDLEAVSAYLSHCIEIAWICAVQDPPIILRRDAPVEFDTNAFKEYTREGKYTEFVVLPALYLHDGGVLLSKGVAQGSDTTAPDQKDTIAGMSSKAQEELRDINPNIAELSYQFRPTRLAEKMSELYEHQWTDAYTVLEEQGLGEKQIIESLLDMFMVIPFDLFRQAAYTEFRKLASEKLCERVKRRIEIPTEIVMKRLKSENQDLEAVSVYVSHCIEIAWICAVQDPPIIFRRDAPVEFDTNAFKEYTRRGKYTEFVVWPALYLHDGGVLLLKGVAQGTDTKTPEVKYQLRLDGYHQQGTSKTTNNAFSANSLNVRF